MRRRNPACICGDVTIAVVGPLSGGSRHPAAGKPASSYNQDLALFPLNDGVDVLTRSRDDFFGLLLGSFDVVFAGVAVLLGDFDEIFAALFAQRRYRYADQIAVDLRVQPQIALADRLVDGLGLV